MGSTILEFNLSKANSALVVAVQETDFQRIVYTITSSRSSSTEPMTCFAGGHPPWGRASQESILVCIPCVLQGGSKALLICHSTESSWCRERWKPSPSKAEWQLSLADFEEWVLSFEDLGNPALIKEHTAERQFPFTLKPQWQGHSSPALWYKPPKTLTN